MIDPFLDLCSRYLARFPDFQIILALGRSGLKKKSSVEAFFKPLFGTSASNTMTRPSTEPKTEPTETIKRYRCVVGTVQKHIRYMIYGISYTI